MTPPQERKPLVKLESRETYTVRFKPSEWEDFCVAARRAGLGARTYLRECCLMGHRFYQMQAEGQGRIRVSP